MNYKKKAVFEITANKKFRSKSTYMGRNKKNNKNENCFSEENRDKFKKINSVKIADIKVRSSYLMSGKRNNYNKYRTQRIIDKMKFPNYPKSTTNYRTLSPNLYFQKK